MAPTPECVDITPTALQADNPRRQENIEKINAATKKLDDVIRRRSAFLSQLIHDEFDGMENVLYALIAYRKADNAEALKEIEELGEQYSELLEEHIVAGDDLLQALAGK